MKNVDNLEKAVKFFDRRYVKEKSKNISILDNITNKEISFHTSKLQLKLEDNEKPLVLVNNSPGVRLYGFSGFVITNRFIHFSLIKRSFFASLFPIIESRKVDLEIVDTFQIGQHDSCLGTTYVGHDFNINNQALGLVWLGFGFMYDDLALEYINELSRYLYEEGFLKKGPKI